MVGGSWSRGETFPISIDRVEAARIAAGGPLVVPPSCPGIPEQLCRILIQDLSLGVVENIGVGHASNARSWRKPERRTPWAFRFSLQSGTALPFCRDHVEE